MMLLIGMKISFTKKPMKPMMKKPTDVAWAIFENSARAGQAVRGVQQESESVRARRAARGARYRAATAVRQAQASLPVCALQGARRGR